MVAIRLARVVVARVRRFGRVPRHEKAYHLWHMWRPRQAPLQCWPYGFTSENQARHGRRSLPGRGSSGDGGPSWNAAPTTALRRQRTGAREVPDARRDNAGRRRHRRAAWRACTAHLGHPSRRMCAQRVPAASGGQESRTDQGLIRGSAPRRARPLSGERRLLGGAQVPRPPGSLGQPSALHHHPPGRPPRACRIGLVRDIDPRDIREPLPDRRHAVPPRPGVRRRAIRRKARLSPASATRAVPAATASPEGAVIRPVSRASRARRQVAAQVAQAAQHPA